MKLAPLLAQFLYDHKKLELAGLGSFFLDPTARTNTDLGHASQGISFEYNPSVHEDESLISYITAETGKMKALASSDLNSYVDLAREFLNIGKPFQIEGIGTLVKSHAGLEFTADYLLIDKVKETGIKELSATSISDDSLTTYETLKPHSEGSSVRRKAFLSVLAIATIALIIWISYRENGSTAPTETVVEEPQTSQAVSAVDTTKNIPVATTAAVEVKQPVVQIPVGNYRFVVEVASSKRAYYRYTMLRKSNVPIQIGTTDSTNYQLYFNLPAAATDTARIIDSLTIWYPAVNHRRAFVDR